jgi:hypothetical protein
MITVADANTKMAKNEVCAVVATFNIHSDRHQWLHEGVPFTNQFYCGVSVPLISPIGGNCITPPVTKVDLCLYDDCTYIFRHCVHDLLIEKTHSI